MNVARIKPGACQAGNHFLYVFGGRSASGDFYDSIERYSIETNSWSELSLKLAHGLSNLFCFTF
jgi:N-acetylneuraminic acid mutarotase